MQMPRIDEVKATELLAQGKTDQEVGLIVDAHPKSVARWRRKRGIPSNNRRGRPKKVS